ncbi:TrkH family potassium uptake protein [bacterium]|uniref:TrkH family potassium uptake protein n=1 Tax=Lachnospiraceae TaxID=186803 RepID=UPI002A8A5A09|nr:TrkH family potassium uptake protein [bacterium]MDY4504587.1 TrkH family potassium uptake protein [Bariatricus sp.]
MNKKMTKYIIGKMLGVEAILLLIPMMVGLMYSEKESAYFLVASALLCVCYFIWGRKEPEDTMIYTKEGLIIVATAWIFWSLFGALPFFLSGCIPNFIDAFFETVSGFTTTGSTILMDIESMPKCMNFWRALTHWIGGMGVLVFVMVLTSLDEKNSMHLMRAEVPGPEADKLVPKARGTAQLLYGMYFILTVLEIILLLCGGMSLFDSVTHAFSTAGTGGFNSYNNSVAHFNSAYIDGVITVFMILFGINFNMYFLLLMKDVKNVLKNEELRAYLGIIAVAVVMIVVNITPMYHSVGKAFRYASFQVAAIITTTGFVTVDFNLWPELSKMVLLILMIIGACAGSTGGGIKVSRFLILIKSIGRELKSMLHPKGVSIVKVNGKRVKEETMRGVYVYISAYIIILALSVLLVSANNYNFETSFTAVLTTLNNVGPGLGLVGPVENFAKFNSFSKLVLCFDMLIGRLEIFPFLMLFTPTLWNKKF